MPENIRISKKMRRYIDMYKYVYQDILSVKFMSDQEIIYAIMCEWAVYNPLLENIEM